MISGFTSVDIGIVILLAFSAVVGFFRGFTREFLGIIGWVGAIIVTIKGIPLARPYVAPYIHDPFLRDLVIGLFFFIVTLTLLGMLSRHFSVRIKSSMLGGLDRSLGVIFGFSRGALIICVAYLVALWMWYPKELPPQITQARFKNHVEKGAHWLWSFVPKNTLKRLGVEFQSQEKKTESSSVEDIFRDLANPKPVALRAMKAAAEEKGYDPAAISDMARLIQTNQDNHEG
jgi:membrane protein required for colicin V production